MYTCTRTHAHTHTVTYTYTHCFQRCKFGNQHAPKCHLKIPPWCHGHEWELFIHKTLLMMLFPQKEPCKIGLFCSHAQFSDPIIQIEFGSQSQTLDLNSPKLECTAFLPLVGICLLPPFPPRCPHDGAGTFDYEDIIKLPFYDFLTRYLPERTARDPVPATAPSKPIRDSICGSGPETASLKTLPYFSGFNVRSPKVCVYVCMRQRDGERVRASDSKRTRKRVYLYLGGRESMYICIGIM